MIRARRASGALVALLGAFHAGAAVAWSVPAAVLAALALAVSGAVLVLNARAGR
jgi:hypothetical protein